MTILGTILFLLVFLLIAPKPRAALGGFLANAGTWMHAYAPLSYVVLLLALAAPFVSVLLVARWPKHEEPESPMTRYRGDDVLDD